MIQNTATQDSPWYVVPADNKWFTRVVVAAAVVDTLASLDLAYPEVDKSKLEEIAKAKELSGTRDRYFFKPEDVIKLGDKKSVVVCSQWTSTLIVPFVETAKKLGYKIK